MMPLKHFPHRRAAVLSTSVPHPSICPGGFPCSPLLYRHARPPRSGLQERGCVCSGAKQPWSQDSSAAPQAAQGPLSQHQAGWQGSTTGCTPLALLSRAGARGAAVRLSALWCSRGQGALERLGENISAEGRTERSHQSPHALPTLLLVCV